MKRAAGHRQCSEILRAELDGAPMEDQTGPSRTFGSVPRNDFFAQIFSDSRFVDSEAQYCTLG